jgi:hypothetical protein
MADETTNVFISHIHEDDAELGKPKDLPATHGMPVRYSSINSDKPNNARAPDCIKSQIFNDTQADRILSRYRLRLLGRFGAAMTKSSKAN